jgi:hypothetical protein
MTKIDSKEGEPLDLLIDLLIERILEGAWIDEFARRKQSGRPELGNG